MEPIFFMTKLLISNQFKGVLCAVFNPTDGAYYIVLAQQIIRQIKIQCLKLYVTNLTHCTYCTVLPKQIIHQLNFKLQNCTGKANYLSVKDAVHATFNLTNCTILAQQITYHSI